MKFRPATVRPMGPSVNLTTWDMQPDGSWTTTRTGMQLGVPDADGLHLRVIPPGGFAPNRQEEGPLAMPTCWVASMNGRFSESHALPDVSYTALMCFAEGLAVGLARIWARQSAEWDAADATRGVDLTGPIPLPPQAPG